MDGRAESAGCGPELWLLCRHSSRAGLTRPPAQLAGHPVPAGRCCVCPPSFIPVLNKVCQTPRDAAAPHPPPSSRGGCACRDPGQAECSCSWEPWLISTVLSPWLRGSADAAGASAAPSCTFLPFGQGLGASPPALPISSPHSWPLGARREVRCEPEPNPLQAQHAEGASPPEVACSDKVLSTTLAASGQDREAFADCRGTRLALPLPAATLSGGGGGPGQSLGERQ